MTTKQRDQHVTDTIKLKDSEKKKGRDLIVKMDGHQSIEANSRGVKNIYRSCGIIDVNVKRHALLQFCF